MKIIRFMNRLLDQVIAVVQYRTGIGLSNVKIGYHCFTAMTGDITASKNPPRKTNRERQKRWRKKKLAAGNRQTLIMLTPEAQAVLKREKDRTGETYVQIINRAIINLEEGFFDTSDEVEVWPPG